jgi:hypothetical protein
LIIQSRSPRTNDAFNETLAIEKSENIQFEEELHSKLHLLAKNAKQKNCGFEQYFKYRKLPTITASYLKKLYSDKQGRCLYSDIL